MVVIPSRAQLQHQSRATDGSDDSNGSDWSTMQITTPIIVGVALIIIFAVYVMWDRWSHHFKPHFHRVRDASISKFSKIFMPQYRRRVQHTSMPVTLDESMVTPRYTRRYHSYVRSDSTDSQTPLRNSRRLWRWWRLFGVGPREVKPKVPSHRWVVEGPDESSTVGHGDGSFNNQSVEARQRWASGLAPVHEQTSDDEGDSSRGIYGGVIQIGDPDFSTAHSATPISPTDHQGIAIPAPPGSVPTSARTAAPEYYSAVEGAYSTSNLQAMTTAPTTYIQQSSSTPGPTHSNSPAPPMYSSVSNSRNSTESFAYPVNPDLTALYPWSVRAVGRTLPRMYQHERQMSTESMLANSSPMVPQSMY
ncbi:hypothetical protein F4604DRAFT_1707916 [Suillus subluteus]|nr:hypothetical protein F4604DRAFT_1707916 [Suillus subluteus]